MIRSAGQGLLLTLALAGGVASADDLSGADKLLCTAVEVTVCIETDDCYDGPPWDWNIPQFLEVDLQAKQLRTTQASGENRSTPIRNLQREEGAIFLQGIERGRAFSFVIDEATGRLSVAVARDGIAVSVFGACTPLGAAR